jgi:pilin isopeptide linkage protein
MKKIKKFLALALAAAMTCSLSMAPVYAADGTTTPAAGTGTTQEAKESGIYEGSKLPIQKVLQLTKGATVPNATFTFEIKPVSQSDIGTTTISGVTVKEGVKLTNNTVTVDLSKDTYTWLDNAAVDGLKGTVTGVTVTKEYDFSDVQWTGEGIYRYTVTEKTGNLPYIAAYDSNVFTVDIYVTDQSATSTPDYEVSYIKAITKDKDGKDVKSPIVFLNTTTLKTLVIQKKVTDYLNANPNQAFTFWIKIPTGGDAMVLNEGDEFSTTLTKADGTTEAATPISVGGNDKQKVEGKENEYTILDASNETPSTANGWCTFTLKNNESLTINNVPVGMIYFLYEKQESGFDTYEQHVIGTGTAASTVKTDYTYTKDGVIAKHAIDSGNNIEAFWNIREVPNSGIVVEILPYVAVVLVAAAALTALLISKKRRNAR